MSQDDFSPMETHTLSRVANDLIPWLERNRDPYIWHSAIMNLGTDPHFQDVRRWIAEQPDCERTHAFALMQVLDATHYYGMSNVPEWSEGSFETLQIITERSKAQNFPTGRIGIHSPDRVAAMLIAAKEKRAALLAQNQTPVLDIPEWLLTAPMEGPTPSELGRKAPKMDRLGIWHRITVEQDGIYEWRPVSVN